MLNIVLVEPEIPETAATSPAPAPPPGAACTWWSLASMSSDRAVKRAGLDYWHLVEVASTRTWTPSSGRTPRRRRTCGLPPPGPRAYSEARFSPDAWLFFGKETAGLPAPFREKYRERCVLPAMVSPARSLNLANSAAVLAYEALRQKRLSGLQNAGEMARMNHCKVSEIGFIDRSKASEDRTERRSCHNQA